MTELIPLVDGYYAREIDKASFDPFFAQHVKTVFNSTRSLAVHRLMSDVELAAEAKLKARLGEPISLFFGIYDAAHEQVGWSFGFQTSSQEFYMCNTAILEQHRGRGLYKALLPVIIARVSALGFQVIFSRHAMTNNAVIIPKLRAGFVMSNVELSDSFGTLIRLSFFTNAGRRNAMDYQCGQADLEPEFKAMMDTPKNSSV
jgi:GNAT superfamily N-acetyltransferase